MTQDNPNTDPQQSQQLAKQATRDAITEQLAEYISSLSVTTRLEGQTDIDLLAKELQTVIEGLYPNKTVHARGRISRMLARVALGSTWGKALEAEKGQWSEMAGITLNPRMYALHEACKASGYQIIKQIRLSTAHSRAVEGWLEPVYGSAGQGQGTVQVGEIRRFSDRLLETLLKADDPAKFNPSAVQGQQQAGSSGPLAIQINVTIPGLQAPQTVDIQST